MIATAPTKSARAAFASFLLASLVWQAVIPVPAFGLLGVPIVTDPQNTTIHTVNKAATVATKVNTAKLLVDQTIQTAKSVSMHLKEFVGDHLANALAKAALRSITQSTVNWINNGFEGSPSFVTNPEGFLVDVADQAIGQAIEFAAPLLCSPFRLDIRAALGLGYSFGSQHQIRCRLTDVIGNLQGSYDSFVGGDFAAGGWNSWINITGVPQNNPYGAYLQTVDAVDARIISATGQEIKLLDFGNGFLSWRECEVPGDMAVVFDKNGAAKTDPSDPTKPLERRGPCQKKGPIKTPGTIIEGSLKSAFDSDLMGLAVADEINEVFAALVNQLIKKVFTPGGLVGGTNYARQDTNDYDPGRIDAVYTSQTIGVDATSLKNAIQSNDRQGENDASFVADTARTSLAPGINQRLQDEGDAENRRLSSAVETTSDTDNLAFQITDQVLTGSANGMTKTVRQSSMRDSNSTGPERGNDGSAGGSEDDFIETNNESNPWWEVDLGEAYTVGNVKIFPRQGVAYREYLGGAHLFLTNTPYDGSTPDFSKGTAVTLPTTDVGFIDVELDRNNTGRYLRLQRQGQGVLSFVELEARQSSNSPKAIPQFTNLTDELYEQRNQKAVNMRKGVVLDPATPNLSQELERWQAAHAEFGSIKGIDRNRNGNGAEAGSSLVGIVNPLWDGTDSGVTCTAGNAQFAKNLSGCQNTGVRYPWWEIDLGAVKEMGEVKLWRRTDLAEDNLNGLLGAYLFVTNTPYDATTAPRWSEGIYIWDYIEQCKRRDSAGQCLERGPEARPATVPVNKAGRYVRIQKNSAGVKEGEEWQRSYSLWFSEIQIFNWLKTQGQKLGGQAKDGGIVLTGPGTAKRDQQITVSPQIEVSEYTTPTALNPNREKQTESRRFTVTNEGNATAYFNLKMFLEAGGAREAVKFRNFLSSLTFRLLNSRGEILEGPYTESCGLELEETMDGVRSRYVCSNRMNSNNLGTLSYTLLPSDSATVEINVDALTGDSSLFAQNGKIITEVWITSGQSRAVVGTHEWSFTQ